MIIGQALKNFQQKFEESGNEMLTKYQDSNFSASNGWFKRFKRRHNISRRLCNHIVSKLSDNYVEKVHKFLGRVTKRLKKVICTRNKNMRFMKRITTKKFTFILEQIVSV